MRFERNLDIKDAVGIGLKTNAPLIHAFYIEKIIGVNFETGIHEKSISIIDYREVPKILSDIEHKEISADTYHFELEPFTGDGKLQHLADYRGKYIKCLVNYSGEVPKSTDIDEPYEMTFFIPAE